MNSTETMRRTWPRAVVAVVAATFVALVVAASPASAQADCDIGRFQGPDGELDTTAYLQCSAPALSDTTVAPGGSITFTGGGFKASSEITITMHSEPVELGTTTADEKGLFSTDVTVPTDAPVGAHTLEAEGVDPDGNPLTVALDFTVGDASVEAASQTAGSLPYTGNSTLQWVSLGLVLVAVGGGAVYGARRWRTGRSL